MIIISSNKDKITESLEFGIQQNKTCKNGFVDEKTWKTFKKESIQKDNWVTLKELSRLFQMDMTKNVYSILELKSNRIFGTYITKEKAKNELEEISETVGKHMKYQIKNDEEINLINIGINNVPQLSVITEKIFSSKKEQTNMRSLYVIEFEDKSIKIGVSKNPDQKIKTIERNSGRIVRNKYISNPISNSFEVESKLKDKLKNDNIRGEFYNSNFNEVVYFINNFLKRM